MAPRTLTSWLVGLAAAVSFATGLAGQGAVRVASQGVVTPNDPIWATLQDPAPTPQEEDQEAAAPAAGGRQGGRGQQPPRPRPYDEVITSDARTDEGIFKVHRINEQLFYEIPQAELGKDFLWVSTIKRTAVGMGYGGQAAGSRVVRWELYNNRVLLKIIDYSMVADTAQPIARAVADANNPAIARAFPVAAFSPSGDPVIEVTSLFSTEVPELSVRGRVGGRGFDASRTFVERVVSFPENINVEVSQTYTAPVVTGPATPARGRSMRGNSATVVTAYSMVKLPDTPMMPRLFDERVGYFSRTFHDFGRDEHRAEERRVITRYRLEKRNPGADISEPVEPIIYYVDPATPAKFVPWIKRGIEDWQPAFEAAGFRNAIVARDAPADDPDWSPEDARYSVIRWLPSTVENASGPHIHDPRSGEILEADIQFHHNVQNLLTNWYFTQVAPLDPRARTLPLPEDLMGELIRYVVAHEVGHTLGFQHNMKASATYTLDQVRDANWVRTNSHTPTLMDYSRFNYVAQPEDGIPAADLIPKIGPYDKWATMWGYKPIPGATTPDAEKPTLDEWARQQDQTPYLRFSTADGVGDPGNQTEAVGDADAVMATTLGLRNLQRVTDMLLTATSTETGAPYDQLTESYGQVLGQWVREMNHVTALVGGSLSQQKHIGQEGVRFTTVPRDRQAQAVEFLLTNAFTTPQWLVRPDLLRRMEPAGTMARLRTAQTSVLNSLLQAARIDRMVEQVAIDGAEAYAPVDMLAAVRRGIWSELTGAAPVIDAFRRNTQRAYLDTLDNRLNSGTATATEVRALVAGELRTLDSELATAIARANDRATLLHLQDSRQYIARMLDPQVPRNAPAEPVPVPVGAADGRFDFDNDPFLLPPTSCWPDVTIW